MISGFLSSFCSLPFDNAKTKLQKMKKLPDGTFPYRNIFDTMGKTIAREGFTQLWVGYPTFYLRIAPHVCITLIVQDIITDEVKKYRSKN
jgi:solute carrier family 25 (mitochondrial oxoglutarate transporter), member 11